MSEKLLLVRAEAAKEAIPKIRQATRNASHSLIRALTPHPDGEAIEYPNEDDWIAAHRSKTCGRAPFICPACYGIRDGAAERDALRAEVERLKEIIDVAREALNREGARAVGYVVDAFASACDREDVDAFAGVWGLCGRLVHVVRANLAKMPVETTEDKFKIKRYMMAVEAVLHATVEGLEDGTNETVNTLAVARQKMLDRHLREIDDAVRAEREQCAQAAESWLGADAGRPHTSPEGRSVARALADTIRARKS